MNRKLVRKACLNHSRLRRTSALPVPVRRVLPWRASAWRVIEKSQSWKLVTSESPPTRTNNNAIEIDTANDGRELTQDLSSATIRTGSRGIENSRLLLNSNKTRTVEYALDLISPNYDRIAPS